MFIYVRMLGRAAIKTALSVMNLLKKEISDADE